MKTRVSTIISSVALAIAGGSIYFNYLTLELLRAYVAASIALGLAIFIWVFAALGMYLSLTTKEAEKEE